MPVSCFSRKCRNDLKNRVVIIAAAPTPITMKYTASLAASQLIFYNLEGTYICQSNNTVIMLVYPQVPTEALSDTGPNDNKRKRVLKNEL